MGENASFIFVTPTSIKVLSLVGIKLTLLNEWKMHLTPTI